LDDPNRDAITLLSTFTQDPYHIFGVRSKFEHELIKLENDITVFATEMTQDICKTYAIKFASHYEPDMLILAVDREENQ
jgi:hypothetical protein